MKKSLWICLTVLMIEAWPVPTGAQTTRPATSSTSSVPSESAEQMMNQLLSPGNSTKPLPPATSGAMLDSTSGKGAVAPGAPVMNVLREGTFIVNRVGRLTRSADGQQME